MSEFIDFLKHKYAYVAMGEFKPGKFSEAQKLYDWFFETQICLCSYGRI